MVKISKLPMSRMIPTSTQSPVCIPYVSYSRAVLVDIQLFQKNWWCYGNNCGLWRRKHWSSKEIVLLPNSFSYPPVNKRFCYSRKCTSNLRSQRQCTKLLQLSFGSPPIRPQLMIKQLSKARSSASLPSKLIDQKFEIWFHTTATSRR